MYFKNAQYPVLDTSGNAVTANGQAVYAGPRPRASQICPWIMTPIPVPGHASYPSGHATQSALLSLMLSQVMPAEVANPTTYGKDGTKRLSLLDKLAERIARNREVLGMHYPTDSHAGRLLAGQVYALLAPVNAAKLTAAASAAVPPPQATAAMSMTTLLTP